MSDQHPRSDPSSAATRSGPAPFTSPDVLELVWHGATNNPDAPALDDDTGQVSYGELRNLAMALAARVRGAGVARGAAVGICLPRCVEAVVAILGTLAAGCAYVPLDPDLPRARREAMCTAADVAAVIGLGECGRDLPAPHIEGALPDDAVPAGDLTGVAADPAADAYIIFTSGTTGVPNGVRVSRANLAAFAAALADWCAPEDFALTATSTSLSFDPHIIEIFGALTSGGCVRVIPDVAALGAAGDGVTMCATTPSVARELLRSGQLPDSLTTLVVGGEVLPPALAARLLGAHRGLRVINAYGPTEATVFVCAYEVALPIPDPVPLGTPVPGTRLRVVDAGLEPVGAGTTGELLILGPQVATGYVGDRALTRARFVEITDDDGRPVQAYRTGDLGSVGVDGRFHYGGRVDRQLKVRGFRIEPGEVEAALEQLDEIETATVRVAGAGVDAALVAFVVPVGAFDAAAARAELKRTLPDFLVPARFITIDAIPLTRHGKHDDAALTALAAQPVTAPFRAAAAADAPLSEAELLVVALAHQVLGTRGAIRAQDDFLDDLGGTSLTLIGLLARMETTFCCRLPIRQALDDTTIGGLAALVDRQGAGRPGPARPSGPGTPLFLINPYVGSALGYRRLLPHLPPNCPVIPVDVHDAGADVDVPTLSIGDLAECAIRHIRGIQAHGPYLVGGHSAGGLIALEVAQRLEIAGESIAGLLVIDTPATRSRADYLWAEAVMNWPVVRDAGGRDRLAMARSVVRGRLRPSRATATDPALASAVARATRRTNLATQDYRPARYAGPLTLLWTRQGLRMARGRRALGWDRLVDGPLVARPIAGDHNTVFDAPHVAHLAAELARFVAAWTPDGGPERRASSWRPFEDSDLASELRRALEGRGRPRILMFGNYANGNLGDDAILTTIVALVAPYADLTVVSRAPARIAREFGVPAIDLTSPRVIRAVLASDVIAIGGGGLFGNGMKLNTAVLPAAVWGAQMLLRKETMFLGTGAYSSSPKFVQRALQAVAAGSTMVAVRDGESASVLAAPHARIVPDPAIELPPAPPGVGRAVLTAAGVRDDVPLLGISLKPCGYRDRDVHQVEVALEAVDWWHRTSGGSAVLFCMSDRGDNGLGATTSDVSMSHDVLSRTGDADRTHVVGPDHAPAVIKAAIGHMDLVVAHRLHAQIFAWSCGVPLVGLTYERKADAFLTATRQPRFDLWELRSGELAAWLDDNCRTLAAGT